MELRKISQEELDKIIENHQHWLKRDCEGWEKMKANLSYADLSYANLRDVDLRQAIFRGANLSYSDLSYANLRDTNLTCVDLRGADLSHADLMRASLINADLSGANYSFNFIFTLAMSCK